MSADSSRAVIEEVKRVTDIAAIIGRRVQLRRTPNGFVGLCPFHNEKTPSFNVKASDGFYHCFGCKASGDVFTWLEKIEGLEFREALEQLAAAAGIELPTYQPSGVNAAQRERQQKLMAVTAAAAAFYHERLLNGPDAQDARDYLKSRGFDGTIARKYQLGYAPTSVDGVQKALSEFGAELLSQAGLTRSRAGEPQAEDVFRDRLIVPIADRRGAVVAFGARVMPDGRGPKYLNSPTTPIYDKSSVLFNLHQAIPAIRQRGSVIVCEGYTDVMGFGLCELDNAVATCGTAFTENHVRLLEKHTKRVLLAFDADTAGESATSSFQRWEVEYDLEVAVVEMPAGSDPGDLAVSDPDRLRQLVDGARPLLDFLVHRLLGSLTIRGPMERSHAADAVAELFAPYPSDLVAGTDLQPAVDKLEMTVDDLRERVGAARERWKAARETRARAEAGSRGRARAPEAYDAPPFDDAALYEDGGSPPSGDVGSYDPAESGAYDNLAEPPTGPGSSGGAPSVRGTSSGRVQRGAPGRGLSPNEVMAMRALIDFPDDYRETMLPELFPSGDLSAIALAAANKPPIGQEAEALDAVTTALAAALDRELRHGPLPNGFDRCAPHAVTAEERKLGRISARHRFDQWIDVLRRGENPDVDEQRTVVHEVVTWFEDVATRQAAASEQSVACEEAGASEQPAPPDINQWRAELVALVGRQPTASPASS